MENNIPPHSTGGAIDLLIRRKCLDGREKFIDLGDWYRQYMTFSNDLNEEQMKNRLFLFTAMSNAGFVNYVYEWWHYEYGTRYWAYHKNQDIAFYSGVEILY